MTPQEYIKKIFSCEPEYGREILLTNKKAFGDDNEHNYTFDCFDGVAYGKAEGWHDRGKEYVIMSYPTMAELSQYPAKINAIREYCGLGTDDKITCGDIALKYGKMGKWFIDAKTLNAIDAIATASEMDCWLDVTTEGNFRDRENGKEISVRTAMHDLCDGMSENDFNNLCDHDKFLFVKMIAKLL